MTHIGLRPVWKYVILAAWSLFAISPFLWALTTSFKDDAGVSLKATYFPWVDYQPTLKGWQDLFNPTGISITGPYLNTLMITGIAVPINLVLGCLAAYGLSRFQYRFRLGGNRDITFFFVSQRILPPVVLALPYFILMRTLGLLDSALALIIVHVAMLLPITVWVLTAYFEGIPRSLDEAALVEGCNELTAFFRIILPLAAPGLTAAALLSVVFSWNDFLFALTLTFTQAQTLPVTVVALNSSKVPWWSLSASSLIAILPLIVLAVFLERYMVRDGLLGSFR